MLPPGVVAYGIRNMNNRAIVVRHRDAGDVNNVAACCSLFVLSLRMPRRLACCLRLNPIDNIARRNLGVMW